MILSGPGYAQSKEPAKRSTEQQKQKKKGPIKVKISSKSQVKTQTKNKSKRYKKRSKVNRLNSKRRKPKRRRIWPKNRPKRALKAVPSLGQIPFLQGERLTYKITSFNAHYGTASIQVGHRGTYKGRAVVELVGVIKSSPLIKNFYPIQDSLTVLVDEVTFKPVQSHFHLKEKGNEIIYHTEYNPEKSSLAWKREKTPSGKKKQISNQQYQGPSEGLYESLSSLYALRRIDLKVGMNFEQYVWDGKRERLVEVKVLGEDRILTDLGWIETYKVEIQSKITGGFISRRLLKAKPMKGMGWFAKDSYRTPIKLVTPTILGEVEAVLTHKTIEQVKK